MKPNFDDSLEARIDRRPFGAVGPYNRASGPKAMLKSWGMWTPKAKRRVIPLRKPKKAA